MENQKREDIQLSDFMGYIINELRKEIEEISPKGDKNGMERYRAFIRDNLKSYTDLLTCNHRFDPENECQIISKIFGTHNGIHLNLLVCLIKDKVEHRRSPLSVIAKRRNIVKMEEILQIIKEGRIDPKIVRYVFLPAIYVWVEKYSRVNTNAHHKILDSLMSVLQKTPSIDNTESRLRNENEDYDSTDLWGPFDFEHYF